MNIKLFFDLTKEFFDSMYSPFIEEEEDLDEYMYDEEEAWQELSEDEDENDNNADLYKDNLPIQLLLCINPKIIKFLKMAKAINKID
jgi:hypothetical protein